MERTKLIKQIQKENCEVKLITFLEEGYEITIKSDQEDLFDKLWELNFEGFAISDIFYSDKVYRMLIVPISLDEMTDYVWTYVEKYGRKEDKLSNILLGAVTALEEIVDNIKNEEAYKNYKTFASQIF